MRSKVPRTALQRAAQRRARKLRHELASQIATLREDCGLSQRQVARAAGVSSSTMAAIEADRHDPGFEVLARIAAVLGATLNAGLLPGAGPAIRDHLQARMIRALLEALHPRWLSRLEVAVYRPVRGVIDIVIEDPSEPALVSGEAQSELRRLEQQIRWANQKADALAMTRREARSLGPPDLPGPAGGGPAGGGPAIVPGVVSQLLLLRSTPATRRIVSEYEALLASAYPAHHGDVLAALTGTAAWPGAGLLWCAVEGGRSRILERPPRGIRLGR